MAGYEIPLSINNIEGQFLEGNRETTWNHASIQINEKSGFHPMHQVIQIVRFEVSISLLEVASRLKQFKASLDLRSTLIQSFKNENERLILPNEPMSNLISGRAGYPLIICTALDFERKDPASHRFRITKTNRFEIAVDPNPVIDRLTPNSRDFFEYLRNNFLR